MAEITIKKGKRATSVSRDKVRTVIKTVLKKGTSKKSQKRLPSPKAK